MKAAFHYLVKAKVIRKTEGNELYFDEINKKFENENPIIAREDAFRFYQSWIDVLLQHKGKEYISDKEARKDLISFIDPGATTKLKAGKSEIQFNDDSFGNGLGVFFVADLPGDATAFAGVGDEALIHGIGNLSEKYMIDDFIIFLHEEADYYKYYDYETNNKEIYVTYCFWSAWVDGAEDAAIHTHKILKTPFNWDGYDKPYWWGEPEKEHVQPIPKTIKEIIQQGESKTVEFKSTLAYNLEKKEADNIIKEMVAKTICAFLNSKGGVLFIGINDDGSVGGLDFDFSLAKGKNPKDYFQLLFDEMLEHFLGFSKTSLITVQFYELEEKQIFTVEVSPIKARPAFLIKQGEKKFYVRGAASTRQIKDIEEIINYWIERNGLIN